MNKTQFNSLSTKALYAEPKCDAMEINLAVNICSNEPIDDDPEGEISF